MCLWKIVYEIVNYSASSRSCPMVGLDIISVKPLGSTTRELVN